jgi:predicted dehydrogenase
MRQVFQDVKSGTTRVLEIPTPNVQPGFVKIRTSRSLISPGTERALVEFARQSLTRKARSQPGRVLQLLDRMRTEGIRSTLDAAFTSLGEPRPVGYCNVGTVIEIGTGVQGLRPGDRVVSNGPHAEVVCVPANLCARIPEAVTDDAAVFTVLAAIALQGIRLLGPTLGETVFVMGLGIIGQLGVQILRAHGCRVIAADYNRERLALSRRFGCQTVDLAAGDDPVEHALAATRSRGIDAVLITASTSSNEPIRQAAEMSRKRGRIVLVGVAGLELDRRQFYAKELTFQVSCSYGPGRYDLNYEERGLDYPVGFVRWTEQRNFEAVLDLLADGRLDVSALTTDVVNLDDAPRAYDAIVGDSRALGVVLRYPVTDEGRTLASVVQHAPTAGGSGNFGIIGSGGFTRRTMLPVLKQIGWLPAVIASAGGKNAAAAARSFGIPRSTTDATTILTDPSLDLVMITTRHADHPDQVVAALGAGKHVFVEKPLAIDLAGLAAVKRAHAAAPQPLHLLVGFNRRYSPHIVTIAQRTHGRAGPLCFNYTVNAGRVAKDHWVQDPEMGGGRIIGEACHFIDLFRYVAGSALESVVARQVRGASDGVDQDKVTIVLQAIDGSIGTVHYWANGHADSPKEQLDVFWDGKIARMTNFQITDAWGVENWRRVKTRGQQKGHREQFRELARLVREGGPGPFGFDDLEDVTLASFAATESAATGRPQQLADWRTALAKTAQNETAENSDRGTT